MQPSMLSAHFHGAMADIPADDWNAMVDPAYPHLRHEFLQLAEASGSVSLDTGWQPEHLTLQRGETIVAAMPLYQKAHSWGEFVFDWSWAEAYRQAGLPYYPKLVSVTPFTPATSSKLLIAAGEDTAILKRALLESVILIAKERDFSSIHLQFLDTADLAACRQQQLLIRQDCQFHWQNADYGDFDDFLEAFSSKKRKNVRRERRRIAEAGISHRIVAGGEASEQEIGDAWQLCARTFMKRGHSPYLNLDFFLRLKQAMPESLALVLAEHGSRVVAAAILLRGKGTLYGRYWGSENDYHSLHFETCYYQGIDYCIREGIERFEPGTQGEHKVSRGFLPSRTYSAHWLAQTPYTDAIRQHVARESAGVEQYMREIDARSPFKASGTDGE